MMPESQLMEILDGNGGSSYAADQDALGDIESDEGAAGEIWCGRAD